MKYQQTIKLLTILYFLIVLKNTEDVFKKCTYSLETNINISQINIKIELFFENLKKIKPKFFFNNDIFFNNGIPKKSFLIKKITKGMYNSISGEFYKYLIGKENKDSIEFVFNNNNIKLTNDYNSMIGYFNEKFKNAILTYIFDYEVLGIKIKTYRIEYITQKNLQSICNLLEIKSFTLNLPSHDLVGNFNLTCSIENLKDFFEKCASDWCKISNIASLNEYLTMNLLKEQILRECKNQESCNIKQSGVNFISKKTYIGVFFSFFKFLWHMFYYPDCLKLTIYFICVSIRFSLKKIFCYFAPIPMVSIFFFYDLNYLTHALGLMVTLFSIYDYKSN